VAPSQEYRDKRQACAQSLLRASCLLPANMHRGQDEVIVMFASGATAGFSLVMLFELTLPILVYLLLRRRAGLHVGNALLGAGFFILFAVVLESPLWGILMLPDTASSAWLKAHPLARAVCGALSAALFEEVGRLLGLRFYARRDPGAATPLAYGLGHGGIECILVGVAVAVTLATATPAHLAGATFFTPMLGGLERASALVFQIILSFLVWRTVTTGQAAPWLAAFGLHFALDVPAGLFQAGLLAFPVVWLEACYATAALLMAFFLLRAHTAARAAAPQAKTP
jgi:uncharacterized membrane protein YhfC